MSQNQHSQLHRPLQYTSTSSFGVVRRAPANASQDGGGGGTGGAASNNNTWQNHPERSQASLGNADDIAAGQENEDGEIVRSSIPLRLPQAIMAAASQGHLPAISQKNGDDFDDDDDERLIPTTIVWKSGGNDVFLAGTFHRLEWRARERMYFDPSTSTHVATINIPPGTYRIKFIVDDAWRCSPDLPTAADDKTGNLVNYIDVEDPLTLVGQGGDETQGQNTKVMKANLRRTYHPRRGGGGGGGGGGEKNPTNQQVAITSRSPTSGRAYHPPLLPPSDSFWGEDTSRPPQVQASSGGDGPSASPTLTPFHSGSGGWEHGRDGVIERWTDVIPEPLIAAAQQEEAYIQALNAAREVRRGGAGTRGGGTVGSLGMGVPSIPMAPRLPRHLDKVILNAKSGNTNITSNGWGAVLPSLSGAGVSNSNPPSSSTASTATTATSTNTTTATTTTTTAATTDVTRASSSRTRSTRSRTLGMTSLPDNTTSHEAPGKPFFPNPIAGLDHWAQVQADDSSVLPVPSHVILHHLGTSAIKNGVLAVSDTTRYNKKYITTIYYKPI